MNKKYIEKTYTFPSGVVINFFVVGWYMKTFKDDTITFRIDGYENISTFKTGLTSVELPMDLETQFNIKETQLPAGLNDEEKILNYLSNGNTFLGKGIVKTI